jgi:hypothetical protein
LKEFKFNIKINNNIKDVGKQKFSHIQNTMD